MRGNWRGVLLFLGAIGVVFSLLIFFTMRSSVPIYAEGGAADLTGVDLSQEVAAVQPEEFLFYPQVLLSPGDFEGGLSPAVLPPPTGGTASTAPSG